MIFGREGNHWIGIRVWGEDFESMTEMFEGVTGKRDVLDCEEAVWVGEFISEREKIGFISGREKIRFISGREMIGNEMSVSEPGMPDTKSGKYNFVKTEW